MDQEERIQDREHYQADKLSDVEHKRFMRMNDLQNAEIALKMKMMELQSKSEQRQLDHKKQISSNWISGILGISSIIGTLFKIFGSTTGNQPISKLGNFLQSLSAINPQSINQIKSIFG